MVTKTIYLSGTAMWAKVFSPDEKYNVYKIELQLDNESLDKFKSSGLQLKVRDNNTISLRRAPTSLINGKAAEWGAPSVLDKDNQPTDKLIGNGSKVTCKVQVYDTAKGPGHRLEAVRVEDLVEYDPANKEDMPF